MEVAMTALLSRPGLEVPRSPAPRQPRTTRQETVISWQDLYVFGGLGLLACGLLRRSWSGLALAAAGGFLLSRGLARPERPVRREHAVPFEDGAAVAEPEAVPFIVPPQEESSDAQVTESEPVSAVLAPPVPSPWRNEEEVRSAALTEEEHALARVAAYYHALHRGGGFLPPFDPWQADADFRRGAAEVIARREAR
jgi:hypothetical protein